MKLQPVSLHLGYRVRSPEGEELGRVGELLADEGPCLRFAILVSAQGVTGHVFPVPWEALAVDHDSQEIVVQVSREELGRAPTVVEDRLHDLEDESLARRVHEFYREAAEKLEGQPAEPRSD